MIPANMVNLGFSKVLVGVIIGLAIGLVYHYTSTPDQYNGVYQSSYETVKSIKSVDIDATSDNIEYDEADVDERIITTGVADDDADLSVLQKILQLTKCKDADLPSSIKQRGDYWVLYNYVKAEQSFHCYESITYTAPADYTFLDNLIPLVERWKGPISVALYAPGDDFHATVDSITYLRNCETPLIKQYVSFHIFFEGKHSPKQVIIYLILLRNAVSVFRFLIKLAKKTHFLTAVNGYFRYPL